MTTEQSVLLKLIRQSQFDTKEDIAWDDINLDILYEEANQQAVLGLIAPLIPKEHSNEKWRQAQLQQEATFIRYCFAQDELKKTLDDNSIPFIILKGSASALYYKIPMHRAMGDIDVLVNGTDYERAKEILLSNGYTQIHEEDTRNIPLKKNGITCELHRRFSYSDNNIEEYVDVGFQRPDIQVIDGHSFPMLTKIENGIVLLDHMRQHLRRDLGLRQVIDWMTYVNYSLDNDSWNKQFATIAKEIGLDALAICATRMCKQYMGLPATITWCDGADEDTCNDLLQLLLNTGNFGHKNGKGSTIESVSTQMKRQGLFHWLQSAGEKNWSAYHKNHMLKPLCWLYQLFRYAHKAYESKRGIKNLKDDIGRSSDRYELLRKLNID